MTKKVTAQLNIFVASFASVPNKATLV